MLLLVSCKSLQKKLEVKTSTVKVEKQIHQKPASVVPPKLKVVVLTPERTAKWNKQVVKGEIQPYAIFGYDEQDYLTFSQWLQDVLRYIKSQNAIIETYEKEALLHNNN